MMPAGSGTGPALKVGSNYAFFKKYIFESGHNEPVISHDY